MADASPQTPPLGKSGHFRVIIVGGSISGLVLALALEKCGIDYLLLEKRKIAPNLGQSIFIVPCSTIVLDQLGVAEAIVKDAFPLRYRHHRSENMKLFCHSDDMERLGKKAGISPFWVDRQTFLQGIYSGIKDKSASKIREGEGIASYEESEHGVTVTTDKGNTFKGCVLVGADGVHSTVRKLVADTMRARAPQQRSELADKMASPFTMSYRCLFVTSHNHYSHDPSKKIAKDDAFSNNTYYRTANVGVIMTHGEPGKIFWGLYLPEKTHTGYCPSPGEESKTQEQEMEDILKKYGSLSVTPELTIQQLWDSRNRAIIVGLEEGSAPRWNNGGRVVMIGDAVHKTTSNLGLGGNLCVDDVCVLLNRLVPLLQRTDNAPTSGQLAGLFDECAKAQKFRTNFGKLTSSLFCDFETQSSWWTPAFKYIYAFLPATIKMLLFYTYSKYAPKLNVLPPLEEHAGTRGINVHGGRFRKIDLKDESLFFEGV